MRAAERQLTLVALSCELPAAFEALIDSCVADIVDSCGPLFVPYASEQFHATLIGLESVLVDGTRIQRNLLTDHHDTTPLRMDGLRKVKEGFTTIEEVCRVTDEGWIPTKVKSSGALVGVR